ncbi:glutathione S-transferase [Thraustotheca clavata]|uniref:Glutathione S-transferase n=1 Tax=Thraustotheca clavata TaxID=74557 RepID=A0A1V9YSE3_9STRA|nr:glutathione S-transferase [Thraustotheca clavata]
MAYPTLKVTYFDMPGRAELVRLVLFVANIPFEDERLTGEQFGARKQSLPFKQLPTLTVNGEVLCQSHAMARYAGSLGGLYPASDPLAAYRIDELLDADKDIMNATIAAMFTRDAAQKPALIKDLVENKLPVMLPCIEARLNSTGKYFLGDKLTIADIELYLMWNNMSSGHWEGIPSTIMDGYPRWKGVAQAVAAHPRIQEWNAKHAAH